MLVSLLLISAFGVPRVLSVGTEAALLSEGRPKPVVVAKGLKDQLIFIDPKQSAVERQIAALAIALHASVVEGARATYIERTEMNLKQLRERRTRLRAKWIADRLDGIASFRKEALSGHTVAEAFLKDVDKRNKDLNDLRSGKIGPEKVGNYAGIYLLPSQIFVEKLLRRIGLSRIASFETGQMVTFEDDPVAGTLALSNHDDLTSEYLAHQAEVLMPELSATDRSKILALGYDKVASLDPNATRPAKIRVRILPETSQIILQTEAFDSEGARLFASNISASASGSVLSDQAILNQFPARNSVFSLPLRQESVTAVNYLRRRVPEPLPAWVLHPDRSEPLDLFVRDGVAAMGRQQPAGKCFAMCVSDSLWRRVLPCISDNRINLDGLKAELKSWLPYEQVEKADAVVMRPEDPEGDESVRTNRKALAWFALAMNRQPDPRNAAHLFHDSARSIGALDSTWLQLVQAPHGTVLGGDASPKFNRLLGGIADDQ